MKRPALGAGELGELLGFAQHAHRLVGDLLAERGKAHHPTRALDQGHAEQGLELAQARRQRRLGDVAGVGRFAEMAVLAQRDEILKLLQRRLVDDHSNRALQSKAAL